MHAGESGSVCETSLPRSIGMHWYKSIHSGLNGTVCIVRYVRVRATAGRSLDSLGMTWGVTRFFVSEKTAIVIQTKTFRYRKHL